MSSGTAPPKNNLDVTSDAIKSVLTPVMICMALSVWFVHSLGDPNQCASRRPARVITDFGLRPSSSSTNKGLSSSVTAVIFIVPFIFLMIVFTFLVVWLYKTGRQRYIKGWLMVSVCIIFGYIGGAYIYDFTYSRCIDLDWISFIVAVWNFTISGLFAVFGSAPRLINQSYLIIMSALVAYIFRGLPSFSVWIILGILVLWDLFAVLSPYGPLKMLVEAAREQQDDLPALVYDTNPVDAGREILTVKKREKKPGAKMQAQIRAQGSTSVGVSNNENTSTELGAALPVETTDSITDANGGGTLEQAPKDAAKAKNRGAAASAAISDAQATDSLLADPSVPSLLTETLQGVHGGAGNPNFPDGQADEVPTPPPSSLSKRKRWILPKFRSRVRDGGGGRQGGGGACRGGAS